MWTFSGEFIDLFFHDTHEAFPFTENLRLGASQHTGFCGKEQAVPYATFAHV